MDDERLLEYVRQYPVIYDIYHPKYLDNKYKNAVWQTISQQLSQSDETCRKRWSNIRDQFRKTLNKRMTKGYEGAINFKKYKYEKNLNFLIPFINAYVKESKTNDVDNNFEIDGTNNHYVGIDAPTANPSPPQTMSPLTKTIDSKATPIEKTSQFPRKRRRVIAQSQTASSAMMQLIKHNERTQNDPIDAFFNGLAATVKKFSPYYQHIAKGKIFAIVQSLEWDQMSAYSSYTSPISETSTNSTQMLEILPDLPVSPPPQTTPASVEPTASTSVTVKTEVDDQPISPYIGHTIE